MCSKDIVERPLKFLVDKFGFDYRFEEHAVGERYFIYTNACGSLVCYQWVSPEQAGFWVICGGGLKKIYSRANLSHSGSRSEEKFLKRAACKLFCEIKKRGSLYGIECKRLKR